MGVALNHPVICVVGPTASGKTALADEVARRLGGVVLSADSMQVYRGMDIGTGKIPVSDRSVPYFGLDLADPCEPYSVALYQEYGRDVIERVDGEGRRVVVCGGTGFYVRALVDDFTFPAGDQVDNPIRTQYQQLYETQGSQAVWDALNALDARAASIIPVNDTKRVIRALELRAEGVSYADQKEKFASIESHYPVCMIGLRLDPDVLVKRIEDRVDGMMENGLVDEVRALVCAGYENAITANQAIGYKEFIEADHGTCSYTAAVEAVKTATRRYAKRQRTWFGKDDRIKWLDAQHQSFEELVSAALDYIGECDERFAIEGIAP